MNQRASRKAILRTHLVLLPSRFHAHSPSLLGHHLLIADRNLQPMKTTINNLTWKGVMTLVTLALWILTVGAAPPKSAGFPGVVPAEVLTAQPAQQVKVAGDKGGTTG